MNLLVVTDAYPSSTAPNAAAFVHERIKNYKAAKVNTTVITNNNELVEETYDGVDVIRVNNSKVAIDYINAIKPDAIAVHAPNPGSITGYTINNSYKIPIITWIHGYEALYTAMHGYYSGIGKKILSVPRDYMRHKRTNKLLHNVRAVVYVSKWMKCEAEKNIGNHWKTYIVPNPIDTYKFRPTKKKDKDCQMRGLSVRALTNSKYGLDIAIRAYSHMEITSLDILGQGILYDKLNYMIKKYGSNVIIDTKPREHKDMPMIYQKYDYFVSPSRAEAQGVAMCEAMSCGLPIIATEVGGIPEYVRSGKDGYLVKANSYSELAYYIKQMVKQPDIAIEMGKNARRHIKDKCEAKKIAELEINIIKEAIE